MRRRPRRDTARRRPARPPPRRPGRVRWRAGTCRSPPPRRAARRGPARTGRRRGRGADRRARPRGPPARPGPGRSRRPRGSLPPSWSASWHGPPTLPGARRRHPPVRVAQARGPAGTRPPGAAGSRPVRTGPRGAAGWGARCGAGPATAVPRGACRRAAVSRARSRSHSRPTGSGAHQPLRAVPVRLLPQPGLPLLGEGDEMVHRDVRHQHDDDTAAEGRAGASGDHAVPRAARGPRVRGALSPVRRAGAAGPGGRPGRGRAAPGDGVPPG